MTVNVAENVACDGSHFVVSVQRTDDVKEDSGELIAEKISNIVFDFKVDREAEALLINGYALKLIPQRVRKLTLLAAVIPPGQPGVPPQIGYVQSPEAVSALTKVERNGLVTADVGLAVEYKDNNREITIQVRVVEVEGQVVIHKDLLAARITVPQHLGHPNQGHVPHHAHPAGPAHPPKKTCTSSDWNCRLSSWLDSLVPRPCSRPAGGRRPGSWLHHDGPEWDRRPEFSGDRHHGNPGQYHRHRFHRPHHGFMRFIISVVIPVLIGAAVGVGIGILSVFVAEIAGGVISRIRRCRGTEYVAVKEKDDDLDELPKYAELPEAAAHIEEKQ